MWQAHSRSSRGRRLLDRAARGLARLLLAVFFRSAEVQGLERVPASGPVLFVANHGNALIDPMVLVALLPRLPRFLAKHTLWSNPAVLAAARARGRGSGLPRAGGRHGAQSGDLRALLRGAGAAAAPWRCFRRASATTGPRSSRCAPARRGSRSARAATGARGGDPAGRPHLRRQAPLPLAPAACASASRSRRRPRLPTTPTPCARSPTRSTPACAR